MDVFLEESVALFLATTITTLIPATFLADHGPATLPVAGLAAVPLVALGALVPEAAVAAGAAAAAGAVPTTAGAKL